MRATSVMRFVLFGAAGFGIGGAIGVATLSLIPFGGAVGGASLGLALRDWRKAVVLALLGAMGLTVGVFVTLVLAATLSYASGPMGAVVGTVVGASLGVAFWDWRTIFALAVAGGLGFGVGLLAWDLLQWDSLPSMVVRFSLSISVVVTGLLGGAFLGAVLGLLEKRKLNEERGPRVR
jgi:hypothetical protein